MDFSRKRIVKAVLMLVFIVCMVFANFVAVRMMIVYGTDVYFYDKLLVAYNIGGEPGLKTELGKIPGEDRMRREAVLVSDFKLKLDSLRNPAAYLEAKVREGKGKISFIRESRSAAITVMLVLFGWQLIADFLAKVKSREFNKRRV